MSSSTVSSSTVTIEHMHGTRPEIEVLRIRSLDPDLYLVEVQIAGERLRGVANDGQSFTARSQLAAKRPFKGLAIARAVVRHESSYDEMVGMPGRADNALETSIALPDDDLS